jgi:hypothetical protein
MEKPARSAAAVAWGVTPVLLAVQAVLPVLMATVERAVLAAMAVQVLQAPRARIRPPRVSLAVEAVPAARAVAAAPRGRAAPAGLRARMPWVAMAAPAVMAVRVMTALMVLTREIRVRTAPMVALAVRVVPAVPGPVLPRRVLAGPAVMRAPAGPAVTAQPVHQA